MNKGYVCSDGKVVVIDELGKSKEMQYSDNLEEILITENIIEEVRVVGPIRKYTQVELDKNDSDFLGLNPPVRNSGNVVDSEVVTLVGPKGELEVSGCIIASRHVHISKSEATKLNLKDDDIVRVKVDTLKGGILDNVHIKVLDEAYLELHLDTDDANSHLLKQNDIVEIIDLNN